MIPQSRNMIPQSRQNDTPMFPAEARDHLPRHSTNRVSGNGLEADVDEDLAPLIGVLWRRGVRTTACCEEESASGLVWIQFASVPDALEFIRHAVPILRAFSWRTDP